MAIKRKVKKRKPIRKLNVYSKHKPDFAAMWKILLTYKRKIGKKEIQIGDILRIDYKGDYSTEPQPDIIVLNPSFKRPTDKAPMLHALALRNLSENDVATLKTLILPGTGSFTKYFTKKEVAKMKSGEKKKLMMMVRDSTFAKKNLMDNPEKFYHNTLKNKLFKNVRDDSIYRTYFVKKIRKNNIKLLDHRYVIQEY